MANYNLDAPLIMPIAVNCFPDHAYRRQLDVDGDRNQNRNPSRTHTIP